MIDQIDYWIIASYIALVMFIGIFNSRDEKKSLENFFLASRKLTIPVLVASLTTTWYGNILGSSEMAFKNGFGYFLTQGIFWYAAAFIFLIFLAPKLSRLSLYTLPELIAKRFDDRAGVVAGFINLIMLNIAPYLLSLGLIISYIFHIDKTTAILIGAAIPLIYTIRGSFQTVILTDVVQFVLMFLGPAVLLKFVFDQHGGIDFLQAKLDPSLFKLSGYMSFNEIISWGIIALWTLVDPNFYQRSFAAKTQKSLQWSIFLSIICWIIFDIMITALGLYARALDPNTDPSFSILALAQNHLGKGFLGLFIVAFTSIIMSTIDSLSFTSGMTFSLDIVGRIKNSFKSRAIQLRKDAPKLSLTVKSSTLDRPREETILFTRIGVFLFTAIGTVIAIYSESIIGLIYTMGSLGVASLLIPCLVALFIKRTVYHSRNIAFYAMLSSFATSLAWISFNKIFLDIDTYLFDIQPIFIGLGVSVLCFVIDGVRIIKEKF
jgi:solute:Na+ symporter, SSS family